MGLAFWSLVIGGYNERYDIYRDDQFILAAYIG